ncbi:MAG TPA: hypothetical protein VEB66_02480 [Opitutaceae bacterium]|nr:hypothetical protein [Opitutaceae bacterium]
MVYVLILIASAVLVPIGVMLKSVGTMTGPDRLIRRRPNGAAQFAVLPEEMRGFIARHGLVLADVLQYSDIPFAIFRFPGQAESETYLVVMRGAQGLVCDLVTDFSEECSLSTCQHANGFIHPRPPGAHLQGFPKASLEKLYDRHLAGVLLLLESGRVTPGPLDPDLAQRIERGLRIQGAHIRATPGYWWKAPWWFWVTRMRMANRSVAQQLAAAEPARAAVRA